MATAPHGRARRGLASRGNEKPKPPAEDDIDVKEIEKPIPNGHWPLLWSVLHSRDKMSVSLLLVEGVGNVVPRRFTLEASASQSSKHGPVGFAFESAGSEGNYI